MHPVAKEPRMSRRSRLSGLGAAVLLLPLVVSCATTTAAAPTAQNKPSGQGAQGGQRQVAVPVNTKSVEKGAIASILTYSGNIQSRANVNVLPRATGRIDKLYVDVGTDVKAGDPIAVLDRTQLEAQVMQALGALNSTRARLELLLAGARREDVESAKAAFDSAQARLQQMLEGGRVEDVASAQANLEAAQAKLNQLLEGATDAEISSARAAVESSRASLQSSNERLSQLLTGGSPEDQRQADAAIDTARGNQEAAQARRAALSNPASDALQTARSGVESADATLYAARERLSQIVGGGSIADQVTAQSAVDSAQAALQSAQERLTVLLNGGAPSDRQAAQAAYDTALSQWRTARVRYDLLRSQADASDAGNTSSQINDLRLAVSQATLAVSVKCGVTTSSTIPAQSSVSPDCASAQAGLDRANQALTAGQASQNRLTQRVTAADLAT